MFSIHLLVCNLSQLLKHMKDRTCCHCVKSALSSVIHHWGAAQRPISVPLFSLHWEPVKASWHRGQLSTTHLQPQSTSQHPTPSLSLPLSSHSVIQLPGIPNTPGQLASLSEPACSEQSGQVLSGICKDWPHSSAHRRHNQAIDHRTST